MAKVSDKKHFKEPKVENSRKSMGNKHWAVEVRSKVPHAQGGQSENNQVRTDIVNFNYCSTLGSSMKSMTAKHILCARPNRYGEGNTQSYASKAQQLVAMHQAGTATKSIHQNQPTASLLFTHKSLPSNHSHRQGKDSELS